MRDFRKLTVWEKSHQLTLLVYKLTQAFPKDELYGMTSQMRRAASSIPMNIAEGCGRDTEVELARFMQIAMGSASELEYQLLLARDLQYLNIKDHEEAHHKTIEVKRMLAPFINKLRGK